MSSFPAAVPARREVGARSLLLRGSWSTVALCFGTATAAVTATIGPDARWLGALGRVIVERGSIPHGVPFAAAPSSGWPNVPVLAELVFRGLTGALGDRGLLLAQLVAVSVALAGTRREMRRLGATDAGAALVLALVVPGALLAFAGIRAQLFSLALFPLLVALLRREAAAPSRRIWLLPPLVALWSNLHGVVLLGLAAAGVYLVLERARLRPLESLCVAASSLVALCATPALAGTPRSCASSPARWASRAARRPRARRASPSPGRSTMHTDGRSWPSPPPRRGSPRPAAGSGSPTRSTRSRRPRSARTSTGSTAGPRATGSSQASAPSS